jgi:hypothetical protein
MSRSRTNSRRTRSKAIAKTTKHLKTDKQQRETKRKVERISQMSRNRTNNLTDEKQDKQVKVETQDKNLKAEKQDVNLEK